MPRNKIKKLNRSAARPHAFIVLWVFKHVGRICTRLMGTLSISLHQAAPGLSRHANQWKHHLPMTRISAPVCETEIPTAFHHAQRREPSLQTARR